MIEREQLRHVCRWNRELSRENRRLSVEARRWKRIAQDAQVALAAVEVILGSAMDGALETGRP
jgi:hypothetical protein